MTKLWKIEEVTREDVTHTFLYRITGEGLVAYIMSTTEKTPVWEDSSIDYILASCISLYVNDHGRVVLGSRLLNSLHYKYHHTEDGCGGTVIRYSDDVEEPIFKWTKKKELQVDSKLLSTILIWDDIPMGALCDIAFDTLSKQGVLAVTSRSDLLSRCSVFKTMRSDKLFTFIFSGIVIDEYGEVYPASVGSSGVTYQIEDECISLEYIMSYRLTNFKL
jgi:hypothetical protein